MLYELPEEVFDWKGLNILRVGIRLGEVKNDRFEPAHSLVACVKASECKRSLNLPLADNRVEQYLHGEMIEGDIPNGWCLVCVDGYPLGLGKAVNGSIKNHLPKGIRKVK